MNKNEKLDNGNIVVDGKEYAEVKTDSRLIRKGRRYWYVENSGAINSFFNVGDNTNYNKHGYLLRTEAEAETYSKYLALQSEYEKWCSEYPCDWTDREQIKYCLGYYYDDNKIRIDSVAITRYQETYCSNKDHLQKFIDTHDPDDLKLLLGVTKPQRCWLEL